MSLREILSSHGFRFEKKYGQNFISDVNLLKSVASLAEVGKDDCVVEIGVGAGTLTRELAERCRKVIGYEIDRRLEPILQQTLSGAGNAEIIFKDFLKESVQALEQKAGGPYAVVANLPYYITTPVIMRFVEQADNCFRIVVMVQEEVAERLAAEAGTPEYGAITAAIAAVGDARIVKRVPRSMFYPVPNVDSAVVRIDLCGNKFGVDLVKYREVVRAAFSSRRKTLANNLINAFSLSRERAEEVLEATGTDKTARGETLTAEKFALLTKALDNVR